MIFAVGDLPIEDLSSPVWPEAECHQDHDFFSAALMAFPLLCVRLNGFLLVLNGDPNAITLNHRRCFWEMLFVHMMHEWFHLINELITGTQSNGTSQLTAPSLFDGSQTLPQAAASEGILLEIYPKPLILLQESKRTNHIVMAALTLHQRNLPRVKVTVPGFQIPLIMPVSREVMGILASTMPTFPVNFLLMATGSAVLSFFSSQLRRHFCFQAGAQHLFNGL
jgi:hypothetical protein